MSAHERHLVCGTRAVVRRGPDDWRVVCATCNGGGTTRYPTREAANAACVRDSNKPCTAGTYRWGKGCGAR